MLVGCIYRSPSGDERPKTEELIALMKHACNVGYSHLLLCGDFNMPHIDWEIGFSADPDNHVSHDLIEAVQECGLYQHVTQPTRYRVGNTPSVLDLIMTNEEGMVQALESHPGLGNSDHVILRFVLACYTQSIVSGKNHLNYNRGDYDKLNEMISSHDWEVSAPGDIEVNYTRFLNSLEHLTRRCVPHARLKCKKRNIYMNVAALRLRKKKRLLWQQYARSRDVIDYARFKRVRNDLRQTSRKLRQQFEEGLVRDLGKNPKPFWRYANSRLKTKSRVEDLKDADGVVVSDCQEKATLLNRFFCSVFTSEAVERVPMFPRRYTGPDLEEVEVTVAEVERRLAGLRPFGAPGPDGVHPRMLKETARSLAAPLAKLFQQSLGSGRLPSDWKLGQIVPIHKKGSKQLPSNYRPVSLTSVFCKLLESIVRDAVMTHLTDHELLNDAQHGFRPRRSCASQLLTALDDWTRRLENGEQVDVAYLDFSKAFDSVPHRRLLQKLWAYGIGGRLLEWIEDFLIGRQQRVVVDDTPSSWEPVRSGVPQGSVLGPLLFVLYVNDLPEVVRCKAMLFADDTKIFFSSNDVGSCRTVWMRRRVGPSTG